MMSNGAIPNQGLLNEEHKNLVETLDRYSLETIIIPFKSELEESKKYDFVLCVIIFSVIRIKIL